MLSVLQSFHVNTVDWPLWIGMESQSAGQEPKFRNPMHSDSNLSSSSAILSGQEYFPS